MTLWHAPVSRGVRTLLLSGPGRSGLYRVLAVVLGVLASILIARFGGPEIKGATAALMAANALVFSAINLDLGQQVLREGRERGSQDQAFTWLIRPWALYLVAGSVFFILVHPRNEFIAWVGLGSATLAVSTQAAIVRNGVSGPIAMALSAIAQQATLAIGALALFALDVLTETAALALVVTSYTASAIASRPSFSSPHSDALSSRPSIARLSMLGMKWQPLRLGQLLLSRLDTLVVFVALGNSQAGIYSVGLSLSALALIFPAQISHNTLYLGAQNRTYSLRDQVRKSIFLALGGATVLVFVGYPSITMLYGDDYERAYFVLIGTLPGVVALSVFQVLANHVRISGRPSAATWAAGSGVLAMTLALLFLVPTWGVFGAGVASSIGAIFSAGLLLYLLRAALSDSTLKPGMPSPKATHE